MTRGYLLLLAFCCVQMSLGSGVFELQIIEMVNFRGETADGACCGGARRRDDGVCGGQCATSFRVCLKEYQSNVSSTGSCSFGNTSSAVLGGNAFKTALDGRQDGKIDVPFVFRWTRSFTLILQAVDLNNTLIEETSYSGLILPSASWHALEHAGRTARITYRVRVRCDPHYFNSTCTKFCRPRDDKFGHYACDKDGDKACLAGWRGTNCEVAACKSGCHPTHGFCVDAGGCECRPGWGGDLCDKCLVYPGCKHGYCNGSAWQCICDTNWGGILCDQDLNYCGTHEPCLHAGTCENTAPDAYRCSCAEGFSGPNCEVVDNPCAPAPCAHGGACSETGGQFQCTCAPGWTGPTCHTETDECASAPCHNGATCVDLLNDYRCICPPQWQGSTCQQDGDECLASPCINAYSCINLVGDYRCRCRNGWTGKNCDVNVNDCVGQCKNGATCIDLVSDYHCACRAGYTGRDCRTDVDDCAVNQCLNGGECSDRIAGFACICPVGFTGDLCQEEHDHCSPNPCANNAPCFNTQNDFYCHCSEEWEGKRCSDARAAQRGDACAAPGNASVCGAHGACIAQPRGAFRCACDAGFTGRHCHENINDCAENPCLNAGTCVDRVNSFTCICPPGFDGDVCDIELDECTGGPCLHNGTCVDLRADFSCRCQGGWKGKTCALQDSHCDPATCLNGGTCIDLGDSFLCQCPPEWEGTTCHLGSRHACSSSPCLNGATCLNAGASYTCVCRDGYSGRRCQRDVDDCAAQPCHNGATCVDGVNWFLCACAPGFTGPDCRINVNECASAPCGFGATCVDGIGAYQCLCPPGRAGDRCQEVEELTQSGGVCLHRRQYYLGNASWLHGCNRCTCRAGVARCTQLWCGAGACADDTGCAAGQLCAASACLAPPCAPVSECRAPLAQPACPGAGCARLVLALNTARLQPGASVAAVCADLRRLLAERLVATDDFERLLVLMCTGGNGTMEATLSSLGGAGVDHVAHDLAAAARANMPVISVAVETAEVVQADPGSGNGHLMALAAAAAALVGVACLAAILYWHHTLRRNRGASRDSLTRPRSRADDEKSNNLQNEENLRRTASRAAGAGCSSAGAGCSSAGAGCSSADDGAEPVMLEMNSEELFKPRNTDVLNNTADNEASKHIAKRGINLRPALTDTNDVLTVIV